MKPLVWKAMLDNEDFLKKLDQAQKYAKDSKKKLDQKYVLELEFNKVVANNKVNELKKLLKNKNLDNARKIMIEIDLERAKKQAAEANRLLNNYLNTGNENISRFRSALSKGFSEIGVALATGVVGLVSQAIGMLKNAVVGYFSESIRLAKEHESAFAGVRKTVEATEKEYQGLKNQLRDLSETIPMSFAELAKIMELGGQLGVQKSHLAKFTEVVAKLGIATNMTSEAAAEMLAKYANILKMPLNNIDKLGAVIVQLGNNFATTEADVTNFSSRIAGAGSIAQMNAAEIMAIATAFSSVGIEAEAGGTAVQKVILDINTAVINGGSQLDKYAKILGVTKDEFKKMRDEDSTGTFVQFVQKLGKAGKSAQGILNELGHTDQRLGRAFLSLAQNSDLLTKAVAMANQAREENIALSREAEERFTTTESKIIMEQNERANSMAALGERLLGLNLLWEEMKTGFIKAIGAFFGATTEHNEKTEELAGRIAELTTEMRNLRAEYDAGTISSDDYVRKMAQLEIQQKNIEKAKQEEIKRLEENRKELEKNNKELEFNLKWYGYLQKKIQELTASGQENSKEMEIQQRSLEAVRERIQKNKDAIEQLNAEYKHGPGVTKEYLEHIKKLEQQQDKLNTIMDAFNNQEIKKGATIDQFEAMRTEAIKTTKELLALYNAEALLNKGFSFTPNTNVDLSPAVAKTDAKKVFELAKSAKNLEQLSYEQWRTEITPTSPTSNGGSGSGGSKKDPITKKKEELKKLRDLAIQDIQQSEKSEQEKYKNILEINENYKQKLLDLEHKNGDAIIKKAEEYAKNEEKVVKDKYQDINKAIDKSKAFLKNYGKAVEDLKQKRQDTLKGVKDELRDFNHQMQELDQDYYSDMANRYVQVQAALNKDDLDRKERNKLQEELNFLLEKTTEEQRKQAEVQSQLSEAQKRDLDYQKQKAALQEQINIAKAFSSQESFAERKIEIGTNEDGSLSASYIDEKGKTQQVTEYKNIQYLADLANKQAVMKKEMEDLKIKIETEFKVHEDLNKKKAELEKNQTEILKDEIEKRKQKVSEYVDHYEKEGNRQVEIAKRIAQEMRAAAAEYLAARASMGQGGGTTVNNNGGNTTNNTYNINNPSDASMAVFKSMNDRATPL